MKHKLFSFVLSICILTSLLIVSPLTVSAENKFTEGIYTYVVSGGKAKITDCKSYASGAITIPSSLGGYPVTSIGFEAFSHCTGLTKIIIPDTITTISGYAFYNCSSLTNITIPYTITTIYNYTFYGCNSLTDITIPDSVTVIGDVAFSHCCNLTNVTIGKNVTTIGRSAFSYCDRLTSITLPNCVTKIDDYAFYWCDSLTSIIIPASITEVGDDAFQYCNLTDIYFIGTQEQWNNINIGSNNTSLSNATIHCNYVPPAVTIQKISINGKQMIQATVTNIPTDSQLILACYQGDILSYVEPITVLEGQSDYYFLPDSPYTSAKIMVLDNLEHLCPLIAAVPLE